MYQIIYEAHEVYEFAAEELSRYYAEMTGDILLRRNEAVGADTPIWLGSPAWIAANSGLVCPVERLRYDGYWLRVANDGVAVSGLEARSVLYGVYRLLEEAGCRWLFPGPLGQRIPRRPGLRFAPMETVDNPDFEVRASTDDTHVDEILDSFVVESMEKFDWAAKNRLNTYFLSNGTSQRPLLLREITKRGMQLETGGHNTWAFVPRDLFDTRPELFREVDGVRRPDGNFCSSHPDAVRMVVEGVGRMRQEWPSLACVHLWFQDVYGGAWCSCEKCRHLSPAQQMMQVIRAVAEAYPDLRVDFILYHDSGDISTLTDPLPPNVSAYYAPRERCYTHRISEAGCKRNRTYYAQLTDAAGKFAAVYPFEYYTDMILFNKMGVNLQTTLRQDLQDYKALGVNAVTLLMFNRYSWFAYKLNMLTFARTVWRLACDPAALRRELCETYYGRSAGAMERYYVLQEEASGKLLEFCGYDDVHDIRNILPLNEAFTKKHLADLAEADALYAQMDEVLVQALATEDDPAVRTLLSSERLMLDITRRTASVTRRLMDARHRQAFDGMPQEAFNAVMRELIADNEALADTARQLPTWLIGINGKTTYVDHLCGDLSNFYRSMIAGNKD